MKKVRILINKNFKLLLRSRTSAAIILLGPFLLILLAGLAFNNNNVYNIKIGSYSEKYSPVSEGLLKNLSQNQFKTDKYSTKEECIESVRNGKSNICLEF